MTISSSSGGDGGRGGAALGRRKNEENDETGGDGNDVLAFDAPMGCAGRVELSSDFALCTFMTEGARKDENIEGRVRGEAASPDVPVDGDCVSASTLPKTDEEGALWLGTGEVV